MATAVTPERLIRPEPQAPLPTPATPEMPAATETSVCPLCAGSGWVKQFTPWGCPSSGPCSCRQRATAPIETVGAAPPG